jgi:hypothetical protein
MMLEDASESDGKRKRSPRWCGCITALSENKKTFMWIGLIQIFFQLVMILLLCIMAYACWQVSVSVSIVTSNVSGPAVQNTMLNAQSMSSDPIGYLLEKYPPAHMAADSMFEMLNVASRSNMTEYATRFLQALIHDEEHLRSVIARMTG